MSTSQIMPIPATILERTLGMPVEGPRAIPIGLDFSATQSYALDYSNYQQRGFISMVQSVFVDNSLSASVLSILCPATNQTLKIPAGKQGYLPIVCPNPVKLTFSSSGGQFCYVALLNFPVAPLLW
jgi:hypothetical protein